MEANLGKSNFHIYRVESNKRPQLVSAEDLEGSQIQEKEGNRKEEEVEGGAVKKNEVEETHIYPPANGFFVKCNDVDCIFEFRLFRYIGKNYADFGQFRRDLF